MYGIPVRIELISMDSVSVNKFRDTLKDCVERVISQHSPLKVTRRNGKDFVVVSAEDWEREQETLYVLQNSNLMSQVSNSIATHTQGQGYSPTHEEIDEILRV
jgi:antitoxin YefM